MGTKQNAKNAANQNSNYGGEIIPKGAILEPIQVVPTSVDNNQFEPYGGITIDILGLFKYWVSKWLVILLVMAIGVGAGYAYQKYLVTELYKADATLFVVGSDETVISTTDLSISTALSVDYQRILTSRTTLKRVIKDLKLDMNYRRLSNLIEVSKEEGSHIVTITVTTPDAELSKNIVNSLIVVGIQRIQSVVSNGDASVIDKATPDSVINITPPMSRYMVIGGLIGLLFPLIIMFIVFMLDSTYKGEDEMVDRLKAPILAAIPYYGKKNMITTNLDYYEREAFNTLYGNISLSGVENKLIAITSSAPNEGKSSLSFKLAESITGFNKKVVYVDCDMRNSNFYKLYGLDKNDIVGLSGYLSGIASLKEVQVNDEKNNKLVVIPAGKNPPNPSALLTNDRFRVLTQELKKQFDYVIFDTPPVNAVIDGMFVAKECDGTILVVESAVTDRRAAERAMNDLNDANVNVIGVIVNKVGKSKNTYGYGGYGYSRRKGYGYGYGYGKKKYGYGYGKKGYGYGFVDDDSKNKDAKSKSNTDKNSKSDSKAKINAKNAAKDNAKLSQASKNSKTASKSSAKNNTSKSTSKVASKPSNTKSNSKKK